MRRFFAIYFMPLLSSLVGIGSLQAQTYYASEALTADSIAGIERKEIRLNILGEGFFRNNEYASRLYTGYTLPGFRLSTDVAFALPVLSGALLDVGAYTMGYHGCGRYFSAVAYNDLPYWTDGARVRSIRILPLFRVSLKPSAGSIFTLGNIRGGSAHRLISPIYNPELNLTADPECGVQYRLETGRIFLDAWIDWESFIYKRDNHQEAFSAGISSDISFRSKCSGVKLSLPVAITASHRGGEYNLTQDDTVHTWLNASLGIRSSVVAATFYGKPLRVGMETHFATYAQRGHHYPSEKGFGWLTRLDLTGYYGYLALSYWYSKGWVAPHGLPFANTLDAERKLLPRGVSNYLEIEGGGKYSLTSLLSAGFSCKVWIHPTCGGFEPSYAMEAYLAIRPMILLGQM